MDDQNHGGLADELGPLGLYHFDKEEVTMSKKVLCYDNLSARTFKSTIAKIEAAFVSLERLLMENGDATLNDYYDLVGLPPIGLGEEYGWSGQTVQPRLGAVLTRKLRPAVSVDFSTNPVAAYRNY